MYDLMQKLCRLSPFVALAAELTAIKVSVCFAGVIWRDNDSFFGQQRCFLVSAVTATASIEQH